MVKPYKRGIKLVAKADNFFLRWLGKLLKLCGMPQWETNFWITIGHTIYYPTSVSNPDLHTTTIGHEMVHVRQQERRWIVAWIFLYMFLPLPFWLSWYRWRFEREAYLVDIRANLGSNNDVNQIIDQFVNVLGSAAYGWCWPKSWMRRWFKDNV